MLPSLLPMLSPSPCRLSLPLLSRNRNISTVPPAVVSELCFPTGSRPTGSCCQRCLELFHSEMIPVHCHCKQWSSSSVGHPSCTLGRVWSSDLAVLMCLTRYPSNPSSLQPPRPHSLSLITTLLIINGHSENSLLSCQDPSPWLMPPPLPPPPLVLSPRLQGTPLSIRTDSSHG